MPANPPTRSGCAAAHDRAISPPRLRPSSTGFAEYPRAVIAAYRASNTLVPAGLPQDSPASIPATATPAARNVSNIHRSSGPGRFGSVGAYHTHGFAAAFGSAFMGMRKAVRPDTSNTSPSSGRLFFGGSARAMAVATPVTPTATNRKAS